jgi:hypothetical protein
MSNETAELREEFMGKDIQDMREELLKQEGKATNPERDVAAALFVFVGWITTRREEVTAGASCDAAPWANLVGRFCRYNSIPDPNMSATSFRHPERTLEDLWAELDRAYDVLASGDLDAAFNRISFVLNDRPGRAGGG